MILKVNKDICEIKQNEVWNVGDYNVHTVQVELSDEFDGLVNKVRYFVEDNSYDMLITDNVAQVPYEATLTEGTIKIGVYGYDADTNILVQSTSPVNKYITSGTYTGEADNTEPLTPTDKQQMESAIQKNTDDIINLQNNKQDLLISGENIKTINNESILGTGNIEIDVGSINYNDLENKPKINNVTLSGNKSLLDLGIQPAGNYALKSEIPDVSNFITNSVNNLLNYYLKSETYTKQEVNNLIGQIATLQFQVVSTLPQIGDSKYIYLVPSSNPKTQNVKDEYIWVNNSWEQIGSTQIDLTGYATENWVNTQISEFLTQTQIQALINTALSEYTETDPTVPSYVKNITQANITSWNNKSDFSGNYNDLTNKPSINNVTLSGNKSLTDLGIQPVGNYALESDMTEAQNDIEALQTENERLKATLPTTTGEGQDITLDKTAEMEFVKPPLPRGNTKQNTTTGKNLLPPLDSGSLNGLTFTTNSNGITTISGTTTSTTTYFKNVNKILPAGTYTLSINLSYTPPANSSQLILQDINNVRLATINLWKITSKTFTLSADTEIKNYYLFSNSEIQHNGTISIQLEKGPTATSYEPYTGGIPSPSPDYPQEVEVVTGNVEVTISNENNTESKTLPVSLGNIELCKIGNYQDYIYKINGKWYKHKVINKYICTGEENWTYSSYWSKTNTNVFYANIQNDINFPDWNSNTSICNYFITYSRNDMYSLDDNGFCFSGTVGITAASFTVRINKAIATDLAAFKSWLSTHNIILYYELATPTDTEITDTTLISQLEEISKTLSYQGQTNITSNTIALFDVEAYQSTKLILENLDSRLTLVEG